MPELICKILKIGKTTYYKYLRDNVPIVQFLLKFSKQELEEFLETGKIKKFEDIKIFSKFQSKICDNFFHESYSRKKINEEFRDYIFPSFFKFTIENRKKMYEETIEGIEKQINEGIEANKEAAAKKMIEEYENKLKSISFADICTKEALYDFIIFDKNIEEKAVKIKILEKYNNLEIYMLVGCCSG